MSIKLMWLALIFSSVSLAQGVYPASKRVNNFPLGSCGASGTTTEKNIQLDDKNSPYLMKWENDYCVSLTEKPTSCSIASNPGGCEYWKTNLRKVVFPMGWDDCLTPAQNSRLGPTTGMSTMDIGTVTITENNVVGSPIVNIGYFRIFRHTASYQYEMVSASPFMNAAFKAKWPNKSNLDGMKLCFPKVEGAYALPEGKTPLSCTKFNDQMKAEINFGDLNHTSTAAGLYDPGSHSYCPVFFAKKPGDVPPTVVPTIPPTVVPTIVPTKTPTVMPPTVVPTVPPTPTIAPTVVPTVPPTPTIAPTVVPTIVPTKTPTVPPTVVPTIPPTVVPTIPPPPPSDVVFVVKTLPSYVYPGSRVIWSSVSVWVSQNQQPVLASVNYQVVNSANKLLYQLTRTTLNGFVKLGLPIDSRFVPGKYQIKLVATINGKAIVANPVFFEVIE